jgi:plastocyanin domain-containing protein
MIMSYDEIAVVAAGVLAIAGIVWFFWLERAPGVRAALASSGYQEATILVKGGYTPDTIVVERGKPVRLVFRREESSPCSEQVLFEAFGKHATLPEGQQVAVELMPSEPGEYPFTCQMSMLRGTLVVE